MLDASLTDTAPRPTRLADYRPPDFLVDTVDLDFDLDPADTRVAVAPGRAPQPDAPARCAAAPRRRRAGAAVAGARRRGRWRPSDYRLEPDGALVIPDVPDAFVLEIETRIAPERNTALSGLYTSGGNFCTQCEAEGFRRITYFPDRPDVMARYTRDDRAPTRRAVPVLLSNGNPAGGGDAGRRPALGDAGSIRIPKPSYLFALVAGDLVAVRGQLHHPLRAATCELAIWVRRGDEDKCAPRDGIAEDVDALGRGGVRPRIRPRRVQHRRRHRLQHGGDGEQGAQRLQHANTCWPSPRPRPTPTTRASRRSSRTSISTTGPATASPAATGSSCR